MCQTAANEPAYDDTTELLTFDMQDPATFIEQTLLSSHIALVLVGFLFSLALNFALSKMLH